MISVIVNVYNDEKYIKKCLDSIVNQTYKDLDILIVNDGSTDNTMSIIKSYKDKRIRVINQDNMGLSLSRNVGIDNALGDYLYFVDADDFIELDTIEYLYNLATKYNLPIATCNSMAINNYNYNKISKKEKVRIISSKEMLKKILLDQDYAVTTWNKLIKKELFGKDRFQNRIINDMAYTHKIIIKTDKIVYSNQIKYYYLKRTDSISHKQSSIERITEIYDVYYKRFLFIKNKYPKMLENNAAMLKKIVELSLKENPEIQEFLIRRKSIELFKKEFTIGIILTNIGIREKIKLLLFRINHNFAKYVVNAYLKLKGVFK